MIEEKIIEEGRVVYKIDGVIGRENPKQPAVIYDNGIVEYWKDGIFIKVGLKTNQ